MTEQRVLIRRKGPTCTLTLNSPGKMNAIDRDMIQELQAALGALKFDRDSRVVILEGAGGHFCAGADLSVLGSGINATEAHAVMTQISGLISGLRELPQPVICKVRGAAYGGGANLALSGDLVVAAHTARISQVFVNIGLTLDCGGTYFLPRLVGMARASALALLGDELDGGTAAEIGLIYKSCADEELDGKVDSLASVLAQKSPLALSVIKKGLNRSLSMTLNEALEWEAAQQSILLQGEEHKRALLALLQAKRKKE
ncbi:MAG TPA: enoyl-CoA hydratase/isomerase family protein [Syntrophales bacterium]|nr:enoyl-CoA hydratase/isomerase family protein [Syntrophales bacterium]